VTFEETTPPDPNASPVNPETAYGGADAVEKTTYVVGEGTSPNAQHRGEAPPPVATGGFNPIFWIVMIIAVVVGTVYVLGILGATS